MSPETNAALRRGLFVCVISTCGFAWAASPVSLADPLAAIDLNRNMIISDIVRGFEAAADKESAATLKARLGKLRADHLFAASLASSRESLEAIIAEGETSQSARVERVSEKALGDANRDLVYTPIAPCRLVDTRGFGAPIQGGPFTPFERRSYVPNGRCSLPTSNVASLMLSVTTQNLTPTSGGYLTILSPGSPVSVANDVFNLGAEWSSLATSVMTGSAGQFDVFVNQATAQVVVDIVGYFGPPTGGTGGGSGTVTGITAGTGLTGGTITTSGTIALASPVAVANGGTGRSTLTSNGILYGQGTSAIGFTSAGTTGQIFAGTAGAPAWTGSPSLSGNLTLVDSTATAGNVMKGGTRFIHNLGSANTYLGAAAGGNQTATGAGGNTGVGSLALLATTTGVNNTGTGTQALYANTTGNQNTAVGMNALVANTVGNGNIGVGVAAGQNLTTGSDNIMIGHVGVAAEANTIRIGTGQTRTFIAGIRGRTTSSASAINVLVDSTGQLGTVSSSRRFKDDIADMDATSSALMKLRPVTFHYKVHNDAADRHLEYGLVAEEVAEVYPGLVARSADGQVETVMYQYLPSMLLNEYQKQQRTIQAQAREATLYKARLSELERDRQTQTAEMAGLKAAVARMADMVERLQRNSPITAGLEAK